MKKNNTPYIINYFEANKDKSVIFTLASNMILEGKVPLETILSEVVIYLDTQVKTQRFILDCFVVPKTEVYRGKGVRK